jgi:CubicO group peptidase (beta-lactamase class C family)
MGRGNSFGILGTTFMGLWIAFASILAPLALADDGPPPRDLAPVLAPLAQKYSLPGCVGLILHGDQIVALGSVGIRKFGDDTPFLPTDTIHLGSDTKAMTAILIGQLIDQGQLTFDTPMRDIFPDLADKMDPGKAAVTVRQLLNHNAGFPHDLDWRALQRTRQSLVEQRKQAVEEALTTPPATPIGSYSYSNVSFVMLGAIVEAKTGKSWEDVIKQQIFEPLHMTTAGFGPPGTKGEIDEPWGHVLKNGAMVPSQSDNAPVLGPAGTVHCSIEDWSKFIAEILRSTQGRPTLVQSATFRRLITPINGQEYAGGWNIGQRSWAGGEALNHEGSNTYWCCNVWIAPSNNFALLIATNFGTEPVSKAVDDGIAAMIEFNRNMPVSR